MAVETPALRAQLVGEVMEALPSAIHVYVPPGADQSERVLLSVADALGPQAVEVADQYLRTNPDDLSPLLSQLAHRIGGRPLVVDGWEGWGVSGVEAELSRALEPRCDAVRSWLAARTGLFLYRDWKPSGIRRRKVSDEPSVQLVNGEVQDTLDLWRQVRGNSSLYALVLAAMVLGLESDGLVGLSEAMLRAEISTLLPRSVQLSLEQLAVHDRPHPRRHLPADLDDAGFQLGCDLGLWRQVRADVVCEAGWARFVRDQQPSEALKRIHLSLAKAFLSDFRLDDPSASQQALSILEAHRHLVAAGEFDRARQCWRYGAPLVIEAARARSKAGDYTQAASLYGHVVQAMDEGQLALPKRLRAYARHYLHFNRAHGQLEDFPATERGYRQALQDWSENALFWSRLIRLLCFQDSFGEAATALANAQRAVPDHSQKHTILIARTVRGLLDQQLLLDALRIWNGHQPSTPTGRDVERRLVDALARGWSADRLVLDPLAPLVFIRPQYVSIVRGGLRWSAELTSLSAFGQGDTPAAALGDLVVQVREEVGVLVRAYTSDLDARTRLRKRTLLGAVDLLASRLGGEPASSWWVFGVLHRDAEGMVWLRSGGDQDAWFQLSDPLAGTVVVDDCPHLARVATDEQGVPVGPVLELEPGFRGSDEELWDAWRRILDRAS